MHTVHRRVRPLHGGSGGTARLGRSRGRYGACARRDMRRLLVGTLFVLHGLAHAAAGMGAQDLARGAAAGTSDLRTFIATTTFAVATVGFAAAGLGIAGVSGLAPRWRPLAAVAVMASAGLLAAFPRSLAEMLPAVALDALALFAVALGNGWTPRAGAAGTAARAALRRLTDGLAWCALVYVALLILARPGYRTWGANDDERHRPLPGDEQAGDPRRAGDRAITIQAPARDVWPWVAQIGQDRGGFYSVVALERLFGIHIRNAERIEAAWQNPQPGDFVRATQADWAGGLFGDHIGWQVDHVVSGRVLALRYWIFEVEAIDAHQSRLHIRTHAGDAPVPIAPLLLLAFEPAHFVMERSMLLGIRERAEEHSSALPFDDGPISAR